MLGSLGDRPLVSELSSGVAGWRQEVLEGSPQLLALSHGLRPLFTQERTRTGFNATSFHRCQGGVTQAGEKKLPLLGMNKASHK